MTKTQSQDQEHAPAEHTSQRDSSLMRNHKARARGCLTTFFVITMPIALLVIALSLLPVIQIIDLLERFLSTYDLEVPDVVRDVLGYILLNGKPYAVVVATTCMLYVLGNIIAKRRKSRLEKRIAQQTEIPKKTSGPILTMMGAVGRVLGQMLGYLSLLSEGLDALLAGLLESYETLVEKIDELLEKDLVRYVFASGFVVLGLFGLYVAFYTWASYLLKSSLYAAIAMYASAALILVCEVCAAGVFFRRHFTDLALAQLRWLGKITGFAALIYLPCAYLMSRVNRFLRFGSMDVALTVLVGMLILYEIGRYVYEGREKDDRNQE